MTIRITSSVALVALVLLCACNQTAKSKGSNDPKAKADSLGMSATDPRLTRFQRVGLRLRDWEDATAGGQLVKSDLLAQQIRQDVDSAYGDFVEAAEGKHGAELQYLATSALAFASNPGATQVVLARLNEQDSTLAANALVALKVRADPNTPLAPILKLISPEVSPLPKRYAPLTLANVLEAQRAAGRPANAAQNARALQALARLANDRDAFVRLHVAKALGALRMPGAYDSLVLLANDEDMQIRLAAAAAFERSADPRGFPEVVRLLHDVKPQSKPLIRDVLTSYGRRLPSSTLTEAQGQSLGLSPAAWSRWFSDYQVRTGIRVPTGRAARGT